MQLLPGQVGQPPVNNVRSSSRVIIVIAILLFALSGLLTGFAVGAFVRTNPAGQSNPITRTTPTTGQSKGATPTPKPRPVPLNPPIIDDVTNSIQVADGRTSYSVSARVVDKKSNPVHAADITCKLWLIKRVPDNAIIQFPDTKRLQNVTTLITPISGQVQGRTFDEIPGLIFSDATAQTRLCDANGQVKWTYTIDPSVVPGNYDLLVLTDWQGVHYNWSWANIKIKKGS